MRDKLTDAQLVEKTLEGDMSAYGILVNRYRSLVYGLACHVVGSFQDAEDIAQEVFIKAYDSLSTLKDKAKFGSWLRVITLNLCKMWLRKSVPNFSFEKKSLIKRNTKESEVEESLFETLLLQREEDDEETTSFREDDIDSSPPARCAGVKPRWCGGLTPTQPSRQAGLVTDITPEDICINKEFQETVFTALSALPPKNQAVITLFYLDDLSYKEIGDFLNLPVSTVQSRLQKARKQLKEEFLKMAKEIFQDNRLGAKFTQKVLDEILADGRKHLFAGKWSEAEATFLKAVEIKPDYAEAHFYVGYVKENQESYEDAAEWYRKAAELKPDYARAYYGLATSFSCLERRDDAQSARDKAIEAYKKLLKLNPDDPELYEQLGEVYATKGDSENAIAALKHAIALKPDYVVAYAYLAHVYQMGDNIEKAKKLYKQATEIKADSGRVYGGFGSNGIVMAYNNLGSIYDEEGNYDQALFYHQKALDKSKELGETGDLHQTNIAVTYANKGADLATKGKYADAVATYKEAIRMFDELHKPRYIRHRLASGEHLAVIAAFEDFVSWNPYDAEAHYCLACLYSAKGDDSKSSEALEKAVTLESSYREKAACFRK